MAAATVVPAGVGGADKQLHQSVFSARLPLPALEKITAIKLLSFCSVPAPALCWLGSGHVHWDEKLRQYYSVHKGWALGTFSWRGSDSAAYYRQGHIVIETEIPGVTHKTLVPSVKGTFLSSSNPPLLALPEFSVIVWLACLCFPYRYN